MKESARDERSRLLFQTQTCDICLRYGGICGKCRGRYQKIKELQPQFEKEMEESGQQTIFQALDK